VALDIATTQKAQHANQEQSLHLSMQTLKHQQGTLDMTERIQQNVEKISGLMPLLEMISACCGALAASLARFSLVEAAALGLVACAAVLLLCLAQWRLLFSLLSSYGE